MQMLVILEENEVNKKKQGGKPSKLIIEDKLKMTLTFWRDNTTYFKLGNAYKISESAWVVFLSKASQNEVAPALRMLLPDDRKGSSGDEKSTMTTSA